MADKRKDQSVLIANTRVSYLYAFEIYKGDDGDGKFCVHAIIAPNHPAVAAIVAAQRAVATEKWKDKAPEVLAQLQAQDKLCIHRGDVNKPGQEAYAGKLFVSASNSVKPKIAVTLNGVTQEIDKSSDFAPYSGCIANVVVDVWAQDNKFGKRINATFTGIQFLKHDTRLSGGGRAASLDEFPVAPADGDAPAPATAETGSGGLI